MKFSTVLAVLAVALCVTGCKYDKAKKGANTGADAANASDISTTESVEAADTNASEVSLAGASEGKFEVYRRCADVAFNPVYFGFDSTVVPAGELGKIDAVAQHLASNAGRVVVVEGNCDERGSHEYNMSLGENRAIIIRNYLVQSGISSDRIQTRSYGAEKPAVEGHDESAYALNRRGEFVIFQK